MVKDHPGFTPPQDPQTKIWRYMDFAKFLSVLENRGLFFARSDKLGDPFEGSYPNAQEAMRLAAYSHLGLSEKEIKGAFGGGLAKSRKELRRWIMVNCWHMNEHESAAMWKLYTRANESICVQSTYARLKETLSGATNEVYIGTVKYIDYEKDWMPEHFIFYPFMHKRRSYEHERELRALIWFLPRTTEGKIDTEATPPEFGLWERANLEALIERIYIAPKSPQWFRDLLERVVNRYGLSKRVIQSSLEGEPFF